MGALCIVTVPCSMFGIPVSMSAAISGYRLTVERITRIANHNDCFGTLPKLDQNSLLKVLPSHTTFVIL